MGAVSVLPYTDRLGNKEQTSKKATISGGRKVNDKGTSGTCIDEFLFKGTGIIG